MSLHPQVTRFLAEQRSLGLKSIDQCSPDEFRVMLRAGHLPSGDPELVERVENREIPGPVGPIPIRIYQPDDMSTRGGLVYYHGGGWVGGDLDTHDVLCRAIANAACANVIAVDYPLAPEHTYPSAAEGAYAALQWLRENATNLSIDPQRIAIGGDSAGGNLAAVVSLMTRDRGEPLPCLQILVYPITNFNFETSSYHDYADGYSLTAAGMKWFWEHYIKEESSALEPYASPLRAEDLSDLPPALVITAKYDVLHDEGDQYAARLRDAGVPTELTCYGDMIHGFLGRINTFDVARTAVQQITDALRKSFDC